MPANVETAVFANTPAWHGEGTVLDTGGNKGLTIEVALEQSGLNWEVEKVPVFGFRPDDINAKTHLPKQTAVPYPIPGKYGVQRVTDGKMFGTVGRTWEPVQNLEGFDLIDELIQQAAGTDTPVWIEAGGSLDGGKKVWILAHCGDELQIAGENYARYILFTNGHDGRTSVTAAMMDVRVVCQNTLDLGIGQAKKDGRIVRVRHTTKATDRIQEAAHILGLRNARAEELAKQGEWLADQTMSDGQFMDFLADLMPIAEVDTPAATMISKRRMEVADLYMNAPNLSPIKGTKWGALHSVIEYSDHHRPFKDTNSQMKAQFGLVEAPLKQAALDLLVTA